MASIGSTNHKSRSFEAHINLVPYIDLMTTIITFLMLSSVWVQIASLDVINEAEVPLDAKEYAELNLALPLELLINKTEITLQSGSSLVSKQSFSSTSQLNDWLRAVLNKELAQLEKIPRLKIFVADGVSYEILAEVVSIANSMDIKTVSMRSMAELAVDN